MTAKNAAFIDYQQRATEFSVGDSVFPFQSGNAWQSGRVMAVYPAIGMVDVEFPHGSMRLPVEDLQRYENRDTLEPEPGHDNIPGGAGTVSVPGGPTPKKAFVTKVAQAWVKKSLYWAAKDRKYRASRGELEANNFNCPKCKEGQLKPARYKRMEGKSDHLMGCPHCLFLIKRCDIMGHSDYVEPEVPGATPVVAEWDETMDQGFDSVRQVEARVRRTWGAS